MIVKVLLYLILYVHKFIEADLFGLMIAVATPKQIRELMKVDGLTNDEVKSHLQVQSLPFSFPFSLSKHTYIPHHHNINKSCTRNHRTELSACSDMLHLYTTCITNTDPFITILSPSIMHAEVQTPHKKTKSKPTIHRHRSTSASGFRRNMGPI